MISGFSAAISLCWFILSWWSDGITGSFPQASLLIYNFSDPLFGSWSSEPKGRACHLSPVNPIIEPSGSYSCSLFLDHQSLFPSLHPWEVGKDFIVFSPPGPPSRVLWQRGYVVIGPQYGGVVPFLLGTVKLLWLPFCHLPWFMPSEPGTHTPSLTLTMSAINM